MSASAVDKTGLEYWAGLDPNGFGGLSLRTTLDIPVIARVNGYALGGGMEIVLGADIVIAADTARFGLTEPRVGRLALDGGIHQLVRRIPYTQAMGMLLTGRKAEAAEMQSMGLVNEVVPAGRARRRGAALGGPDPRLRPHLGPGGQADGHADRAPDRHRGPRRSGSRPSWRRWTARTPPRASAPSRRSAPPHWPGR